MSEFEETLLAVGRVRHQNAGVRVADVLEDLKARLGILNNAFVDKIRCLSHELRSVLSITYQYETPSAVPLTKESGGADRLSGSPSPVPCAQS